MAYWLVILGKLQLAALISLLVSSFLQQHFANGQPALQVPCFFIFGDSLSDNGNNNNLATTAKSNYQPYGIDFPKGRATGRFTNGRNLLDFIAEELGFPEDSIPPYANATAGSVEKVLKGVNYASGAAGILNESGRTRGDLIPMDEQLRNHQKTVSRIINKLGKKNATQLLNKCIYSVAIGSNDYINNYFLPQFYPTSRIYTPSQYAEILLRKLSLQFRTLHWREARKVVVYGLGLLGCTPYEVRMYGANNISGCVDKINEAVMLFDNGLKSLVSDLNNNLTNATFIFINSTGISLTSSPGSITVSNAACCQVSEASAPQCIRSGSMTCSNRTQYAFWDEAHPTETAYSASAARAYRALLPTDSYPFDIQRLAQL